MLKVFRCFVFFLLLIPFTGCLKKIEYVDTPSGRPEVIIRRATQQEVFVQIAEKMERKGYKNTQLKNSIAEFRKRSKSKGKAQEGRVRFKIMNSGLGVRVIASVERIVNPGTRDQKITDISKDSKDARGLQGILEEIKDDMESYLIKSF